MQWLSALAPFVPLLQTLLWMLFALGLIFWFRRQVHAILDALKKRIETGATVKVGPFEVSDQIKPQSTEDQKRRLDDETREALGTEAKKPISGNVTRPSEARRIVLVSEDLALRAIQAEFAVPITRQVTVGAGNPVDAAFFKDGALYLVEVKTILRGVDRVALQNTIARLIGYSDALPKLRKRYLLVLVFRDIQDIAENEEKVLVALSNFSNKVELRMYTLPELQQKFGTGDSPGSDG